MLEQGQGTMQKALFFFSWIRESWSLGKTPVKLGVNLQTVWTWVARWRPLCLLQQLQNAVSANGGTFWCSGLLFQTLCATTGWSEGSGPVARPPCAAQWSGVTISQRPSSLGWLLAALGRAGAGSCGMWVLWGTGLGVGVRRRGRAGGRGAPSLSGRSCISQMSF